MLKLVIISQNQSSHLINHFNKLKLYNYEYLFVLDRCNDDSEYICKSLGVNYINNYYGHNFMAGYARQLGVNYFGMNNPILFLDGDKSINGDLNIIEHLLINNDCVLIGVDNDPRKLPSNSNIYHNKENPHNFVYSCGIALSPYAMQLCANTSKQGRVWHENFDGRWGDEDRWIGDVLIYNDLNIYYTTDLYLSGYLGGSNNHVNDLCINSMIRLNLRKQLGYEF